MTDNTARKTKVLLIQGCVPEYRVPVFNMLSEHVDLTVLYSDGTVGQDAKFRTIKTPVFRMLLKIHKKNLRRIARKFDVVICMCDTTYLYSLLLMLRPRRYRLIYWGIGVSASYTDRYDRNQKYTDLVMKLIRRADAMLFYSQYPVDKYAALGAPKEKLFVAPNTVAVNPVQPCTKDSYLFVGSLYKQKRLEYLLEGYLAASKTHPDIRPLVIIGDGSEKAGISKWIDENGLKEKIKLAGAIFDEDLLAEYFSRAVLCISPDQAGLSVLKSMGYGVPFVTYQNAITGGEIFNIENHTNGILMERLDEIQLVLEDAEDHTQKYIAMGEKAKEHYWKHRQVIHMVDGFLSAIRYVISK